MSLEDSLKEYLNREYFSDKSNQKYMAKIFEDTCKDRKNPKCRLKGNYEGLIVLNGDVLKELMFKDSQDISSVDCIIIDEKPLDDGTYNIILCELSTSKGRPYSYVENKIKSSGEHIIRLFKEWGFEINDIKCFYLGKYDSQDNPKNKKGKRSKKYNDCMISIRGLNRSDTTIYNYDCGTLLNDLYPIMKI